MHLLGVKIKQSLKPPVSMSCSPWKKNITARTKPYKTHQFLKPKKVMFIIQTPPKEGTFMAPILQTHRVVPLPSNSGNEGLGWDSLQKM